MKSLHLHLVGIIISFVWSVPDCMAGSWLSDNEHFVNFQENAVSGVVLDAATKEPIPFAHVFINNSTIGVFTDDQGKFEIANENLSGGSYQLVISHVGYESKSKTIDPKTTMVEIELEPSEHFLEEVVIKAGKDVDWEEHLKLFINEFLGYSPFARKCKIKNPEVLNFEVKGNKFTAFASQPLIIDNFATGYSLTYHLKSFTYDMKNQLPSYQGFCFMTEKDTSNFALMRKWKKNRVEAYKGSITHLMQSIINDRVKKEGFDISNKKNITLSFDSYTKNHLIQVTDEITVAYKREYESSEYQAWQSVRTFSSQYQTKEQVSVIKALDYVIKVNESYHIVNPHRIIQYGYMGWERTAEVLPIGYSPN